MKRIFKYPLSTAETQSVSMPKDAKILTAQNQYGRLYIWALVDVDKEVSETERHIAIYGTGDCVPENPGEYISTVQFNNGEYVFHVFEATLKT